MSQESLPLDLLPDDARVGTRIVCQMLGRSRATVWRMVQAGTLPAPTRLTPNARPDWTIGNVRQVLARTPSTAA